MKLMHKFTILITFAFAICSCYGMDPAYAKSLTHKATADQGLPTSHKAYTFAKASVHTVEDATADRPRISSEMPDKSEKPPHMELVQQYGLMWYLVNKIGTVQHKDGSFSNYEFPESIRKQILNYVIYAELPQWKLRHLLSACTKSIAIDNNHHRDAGIREMAHNPCKPEIATISNNILTITDTITHQATYNTDVTPPEDGMIIDILKFNQNGTSLAIGYSNLRDRNLIVIFDLQAKDIRSFWVPSYGVSACDFNADGTELITTYQSKPIIEIWNSTNAGPKSKQKIAVPKPAYAVTCCPAAQVVATGHTDGTVTLWDANTYEQRAILTTNAPDKGVINLLAFNHGGTKLAAGSTNIIKEVRDEHNDLLEAEVAHVIQTWNTKNKFESKHFTTYSSEYSNRLLSIAYDATNQYLISFSSLCSIRFWDVVDNTCVLTLNGEGCLPFHATFNPSTSHVMYPGIGSEVTIWNLSLAHKIANKELTYQQALLLNTIVPKDDEWNRIDKLHKENNNNPEDNNVYKACEIIKKLFHNLPKNHRNKLIQIGFDADKPKLFSLVIGGNHV